MKSIKEIAEEICPPLTRTDYVKESGRKLNNSGGNKKILRDDMGWLQEVTRIEKILEPWKKQIESNVA